MKTGCTSCDPSTGAGGGGDEDLKQSRLQMETMSKRENEEERDGRRLKFKINNFYGCQLTQQIKAFSQFKPQN